MSVRQDLTGYSDRELALQFANTQPLYEARILSWETVVELARSRFTFTSAQIDELREWWDEEQDEENPE